MERKHTTRVNEVLEADGVKLAEFDADVTVNVAAVSGDGWNEPKEPGFYEFSGVAQMSGHSSSR